MAFKSGVPFDLNRIQKELGINEKRIRFCKLSEGELKEIYDNYTRNIPTLQKIKADILSVLNERLTDKVHSVRGRIKAPDHLIEKIIRNKSEKQSKYEKLNIDNYNKIITDLIGFRIIILRKTEWRAVHDTLLTIFRNIPDRYAAEGEDIVKKFDEYANEVKENNKYLENSYHAEKPVAYLTSLDDRELYKDPNLRVDSSKLHYRSIHYVIRYSDLYFEIQVRTLFEEGWLEFDHQIKYPYDQKNMRKQEFLAILNSIVTAADRLITFYDEDLFLNIQKEPLDCKKEEAHTEENTGASLSGGSFNDRLFSEFDGR